MKLTRCFRRANLRNSGLNAAVLVGDGVWVDRYMDGFIWVGWCIMEKLRCECLRKSECRFLI